MRPYDERPEWDDDNEPLHCSECDYRWREDVSLQFLGTHQCPECYRFGTVERYDLAPFGVYDDAEEWYAEGEE